MIQIEQIDTVKEVAGNANTILVLLGVDATIDQIATALALKESLAQIGKEVTVYAPVLPSLPDWQTASLAGYDLIQHELGKQNLVVSFAYTPEQVDKVSYSIGEQSGRFYLTIKPKKGTPPLDRSSLETVYAGTEADLIFLVGVHDYESLEKLYFGYESLFESTTVVTIHSFTPMIGNFHFDLSGGSCLSESMAEVIEQLGLVLSSDGATSLLLAIEEATEQLTSNFADAHTFETVAKLLRTGARRVQVPVDSEELLLSATQTEPSPSNVMDQQEVFSHASSLTEDNQPELGGAKVVLNATTPKSSVQNTSPSNVSQLAQVLRRSQAMRKKNKGLPPPTKMVPRSVAINQAAKANLLKKSANPKEIKSKTQDAKTLLPPPGYNPGMSV